MTDRMTNRPQPRRLHLLLYALLIAAATFAAYWQVRHFEFTNYDDADYVTDNPMVQQGLTPSSIRWALTTTHFSYWHPLTWMSHMMDCELFGMNAGAHHVTSVVIHIAAAIVLMLALSRMTGHAGRSAMVAALFALHPLHVESVAWIAERKDVLSTLFWFLTLWAYASYAEHSTRGRYVLTLFLFLLGLMSKPMLVTVPCVMLLLDFWPLRRLSLLPGTGAETRLKGWRDWLAWVNTHSAVPLRRLIMEKVPFFVLAMFSSSITFFGVWATDRMLSVETMPPLLRLANIPVSYVRYIGKMLLPENMVVLYPMPDGGWAWWEVLGSTVALLVLTGLVLLFLRRAPYMLVGWLWYLGTLVPTIGIIPVGWQSIADRYTYVPLVGLFLLLTWVVADALSRQPVPRWAIAGGSAMLLVGLTVGTTFQTRHWRNNETLFRHAVNVSTNNGIAHYNLGLSLQLRGAFGEAMHHYREAVRSTPGKPEPYNNLGFILNYFGQYDQATNVLRTGLYYDPDNEGLWLNLGNSVLAMGDPQEALACYDKALEIKAELADAHGQKAWVFLEQGQVGEGLAAYRAGVKAEPDHAGIRIKLAWLLSTHTNAQWRGGEEALEQAQQAVALTGREDPTALLSLAAAQGEQQDLNAAMATTRRAQELMEKTGSVGLKEKARAMMKAFESGQAYRE